MNRTASTPIFLLVLLLVCASDSMAQRRPDPASPEQLRRELDETRERIEKLEDRIARSEDAENSLLRSIRVFGDIGFRFHHISHDGVGTKAIPGYEEARFEGLLRLGVTGYFMDTDKHRLRYEARLATEPLGDFGGPLGSPTVGWRPVDSYGRGSPVVIDRLLLSHTYKGWLRVAGGRFQSPFHGTQLVFDDDLALTGLNLMFDLGRFAKFYEESSFTTWRDYELPEKTGISRIHAKAAAYVFSEDQFAAPVPGGATTPHGASLQIASKFRVRNTDTSTTVVLGWHWFEQMEGVAQNISTGNTFTTTSRLNVAGLADTKFRLGELFIDFVLLEHQSASLRLFTHAVHNFGASDRFMGFRDEGSAIIAGFEWGTLEFEEALTFLLRYHYAYIEANAAIPEFNHDVFSTNYKGHFLGMQFALHKDLIPFIDMFYGTRVDQGIGGVGTTGAGALGDPSDDSQFRLRMGLLLHF